MTRICFVCHGNICRSPMAEFIFKDIVNKEHTSDSYYIASAATHTDEIIDGRGNPVYPPAQRVLKKYSIAFDDREAVLLTPEDYSKFDYFFCMDDENISFIFDIFGSDPDNKVHKLMEFTKTGSDVSDPWFTNDFEKAYSDINKGCKALYRLLSGG